MTDLTEYISKIGESGLALHKHSNRNCVYKECEAILVMKKEKKENLDTHKEHLREENFPENYGMAECNVIVREHNNEKCIKIMEQWWEEFLNYSKRDQLSFPYVLFKNGVKIEEVTTLGDNVFKNYSFRILTHK